MPVLQVPLTDFAADVLERADVLEEHAPGQVGLADVEQHEHAEAPLDVLQALHHLVRGLRLRKRTHDTLLNAFHVLVIFHDHLFLGI